jgi:hypothetical protein
LHFIAANWETTRLRETIDKYVHKNFILYWKQRFCHYFQTFENTVSAKNDKVKIRLPCKFLEFCIL